MKLLIITTTIGDRCTKGSEVFCSELTRRLRHHNQVTVITSSDSGSEVEASGGVVKVGSHLVFDVERLQEVLSEHIAVREFDLVYNLDGMLFGNTVASALLAANGSLPLVNHFQTMLGSYAAEEGHAVQTIDQNRESQKGVAEQAILNIFLSQSEFRDAMAAGFEISGCPVSVVPAGVRSADLRKVVADERLMPKRREDGTRKTVFVTAGRFSDYIKGGDLIYRAFTYLYRSNPDVFLLVISNSRRFSSLLRELPEEAYRIVDWLPRPEFLATLAAADVVAVPSRYESFGLIAIEAMMLGRPVIANNVGGLQEIIHHRRTGMLNDLRDGSYGLYRAMRLFADDARFRTEVGKTARRNAEREFDLDRVADLVQKSLEAAVIRNKSLAAACPYY